MSSFDGQPPPRKRQHSATEEDPPPSKRTHTDVSSAPDSSPGLPAPGASAPSTTETARNHNVPADRTESYIDTESHRKMRAKARDWEGCCVKAAGSLQLLAAIYEGHEHVSMLKNTQKVVGDVSSLIKVLDRDEQKWSSFLQELEEQASRISKHIKRMEAEDAAPDPDSSLIKPIQLYAKELETLVADLLAEHAPDNAGMSDQYGMIKETLKRHGIPSSEAESAEAHRARFIAAAKLLMDFIEMYTKTDASLSHQTSSNENPGSAFQNAQKSKVKSKAPSSGGSQHTTCLPGTREDILAEIKEWGDQAAIESRVFCIMDMAGTGKSTIANHMAQKWEREGQLVARFFFSRGNSGLATSSDLCVSMAQEMKLHHDELAEGIKKTLENKDAICTLPLVGKWEKLVANHALRLKGGPYFFVIDALDECDESERQTLLECLLKNLDALTPFDPDLRLLLTTRPEGDITIMLDENGGTTVSRHRILRRLDGGGVDLNDVSKYVHHQLRHISNRDISPEQREQLIKRSAGLFIFASTACNVLTQSLDWPEVFKNIMSSKDSGLDGLYREILRSAVPEDERSLKLLQQVLGVVLVATRPLSRVSLRTLLAHIGQIPVENIIRRLGSVLGTGSEVDPVYFLHPTFREFLLQQRRSTVYTVSPQAGHQLVATACLKELILNLRRDICRIKKPGESAPWNYTVKDMESRLEHYVSDALRYATMQWAIHASHGLHQPAMRTLILELFLTKLLNWIELSALMNRREAPPRSIVLLKVYLEKHADLEKRLLAGDDAVTLLRWCADILKFAKETGELWYRQTLLLYLTALSNWQSPGPIFTHYASVQSEDRPATRIFVENKHRGISSIDLYGHSGAVSNIAFSPDGRHLASCSWDNTTRIWNSSTGIQEAEFKVPGVKSLAYLSTGTELVASTRDGQIQRINLESATSVTIQLGGKTSHCDIRISLKDSFILCGTGDGQLMTIDLGSNTVKGRVQAHAKAVCSVDISADGTLLASSGREGIICLWDGNAMFSDPRPIRRFSIRGDRWDDGKVYVALSSKNRVLAARAPLQTCVWCMDSGTVVANLPVCSELSFSRDGSYLAMALSDSLELRDGKARSVISKVEESGFRNAHSLLLSPNNVALAVSGPSAIHIWQMEDILTCGKKKASVSKGISTWAFSGDYRRLVQTWSYMGDEDGKYYQKLIIWDVLEGRKIAVQELFMDNSINVTGLWQTGRFIISAGRNHIEFLDGNTGDTIGSEVVSSSSLLTPQRSIASPCERLVAIIRGMTKDVWEDVMIWNIDETLQPKYVCTLALLPPLIFKWEVPIATFDSHGRYLRIKDRVWDVSNRLPLRLSHKQAVKTQGWPTRPESRLYWSKRYEWLESEDPLIERYHPPLGWKKGETYCHIDGDLAVLHNMKGEFVVLDFRHMPLPAPVGTQEAAIHDQQP